MMSLFFLYFFCVVSYLVNFFSFMNSLLILESISIILFLCLFLCLMQCFSMKILMFYFVFLVSESAVGLSILVKSVKYYGAMSFKSMNLSLF
uniref:NADH dehydrogenase subunit 4L n=1 Tax=Thrips hawaiiensis TaxID=163894 RepID=A0A8A0Y1W5_9NEOP|nr:NADH dehydrogenase subunit 4L [Thrips hawaiiensis]QSQ87291.1 NADH dehydrogenase subunit 4L [Thrips hawaiiensis]